MTNPSGTTGLLVLADKGAFLRLGAGTEVRARQFMNAIGINMVFIGMIGIGVLLVAAVVIGIYFVIKDREK